MSDSMTRAFLAIPWLTGILWLVIQGADWSLTLYAAHVRRDLFAATGTTEQSAYELNPLFRADVSKLRFFSPRFLVTWIGMAVLLPAFVYAAAELRATASITRFVTWLIGCLLGVLIFTRLSVIGRHLRNVFLLTRLLRLARSPSAARGAPRLAPTQFDTRTNLLVSAIQFGEAAVLLTVAAALSKDPWVTGGAIGLLLLAGKHLVLGLSRRE